MDAYSGKTADELILFHGMRKPPEGDFLSPVNERIINGRKDKYLFATPYLAKTLMFAFDWHAREAIIGGAVDGSTDQFIVLCNREKTLKRDCRLYVYSFKGEGLGFYKALTGSAYLKSGLTPSLDTREFCTTSSVSVSKLHLYAEISEIDELMKRGLQIFSTEKTYQQLIDEDFLGESYLRTPSNEWLCSIPQNGFIWENEQREINPNPLLFG